MRKLIFFIALLMAQSHYGQKNNLQGTLNARDTTFLEFNYKALIIPSVMIGYGLIATESHSLIDINNGIKEEVTEHIDEKFTVDDISQYVPAIAVYGLNMFGVKGKHNLKDRSIVLATSYLIMSSSILGLKTITRVERPDGSSRNSFPSGHTATAFVGAEFLWQEYKDVSIWYGLAGYAVATGTGFFRIYNDRHWFSDVVAGAGIGILSTKIAYWITPFIEKKCLKSGTKRINMIKLLYHFTTGKK
ncbi:phosphatase PAP2 family protein [Galbibacter pacificus]|uniref:Phosphatase PAP2 family protein n=1 Tax=Galbibacter pacificus TaxID=2996052 RepID=A0ABT6FML2_9FLAO|nr:phosphatase PAP2 family protein [Galbibacter pacificus]MDG3581024.1 phosphatase PAP2 family protein [Galbibacter pacificus]MDG3584502.1 phosphatase PAP2 family protein [Galbibacter pacificus]